VPFRVDCRLTGDYPETGFETISLQLNAILIAAWEAASMAHRKTSKRSKARTMLRLADLEQSKNAVLHSLGAASSQESYGHAIDEFIGWYCSEPRLAFNRTVVLRYLKCLFINALKRTSSDVSGITLASGCS